MFLDLALLKSFLLVTSPALLDELDEKLRMKFEVSAKDGFLIRAKLERNALVVSPENILRVIRDDADDDRVLECAVTGSAEYIVSGDRHLLRLGTYQRISILTVREFMDSMEGGS